MSMLLIPNGRTLSAVAVGSHYLLRLKGRKTAVKFLTKLMEILGYIGVFQPVTLSPEMVEMPYTRIVEKMYAEYTSVADILCRDDDIKPILEKSLRFTEEMNLFFDIEEGEVDEEEAPMTSEEETPKRKLWMLCLRNGIVIKDVGAVVVPPVLSQQQRIAKLPENDHSDETISKAARSFDRWVSVDPKLIVVRRVGRGLRTNGRRTRVTTSDDALPPMTAGKVFIIREALSSINYTSASPQKGGPTTTVWLAGSDHTHPEFIRAKRFWQELSRIGCYE